MAALETLEQLGITLPPVAAPVAAYTPAITVDNQVWTSGQLPFVDGQLPAVGKVGAEVSVDEAEGYARTAALNALAAIEAEVGLNRVRRVLKVVVFVASAADFYEQPQVANGASNLMTEVFGDEGTHARSAVGVAVLPKNSPVEVEVIVEIA